MSARSLNPDSDDEDGVQPEARNVGESSSQSGTESEEEEDVQPPPAKKKRAASEQRVWTEINRWHRIDSTDAEILIFIRRELDELSSSSGLLHIPGSHKELKNDYGDFQFRRSWISNNGLVRNTAANCPLWTRCGCKCQAKLLKHLCTQFCSSPVRTLLRNMSLRKARPNFFHISK